MKKLNFKQMETIEAGDGNCGGIYNSCLVVAAIGGAAITVATSGWGAYLGVLAAGAGMEYCRQSAIGCYG